MTTIPPQQNQKNKRWEKSGLALGRRTFVGLALLLGALGQVVAETNDAGEQLYRRGYPTVVNLEWAVSDYNAVHHADSVARDYPELNVAEILSAISQSIAETSKKDKRKLARLAALKKFVRNGSLPKGSMLTFQYADKNRTPYWFQWGTLSNKFSIFLISGLDENPEEESEYNEKAFIIGILIRSHKRIDQEWKALLEKVAEKMKRKN